MKAEYFPPKEDVILQNEAPTDFYILVTGAAVRYYIPLFFFSLSLTCRKHFVQGVFRYLYVGFT